MTALFKSRIEKNKKPLSEQDSHTHPKQQLGMILTFGLFLVILSTSSVAILSIGNARQSLAQVSTGTSLSQTTFPPPIFYKLRNEPSYVIRIPYSELGNSSYTPPVVSIPTNMTVIWFNDDNALHTVTTVSNRTYSPPMKIDSSDIPPNGGSFIWQFVKPGIYDYFDAHHPTVVGRIKVGSEVEYGKNMNMLVGGIHVLPFTSNLSRFVVSFVPTKVSIPPAISLTFNVTISNSTTKLYSHQYDDLDGILDLELIPATHSNKETKNIAQQFNTWGPDFIGQEGHGSTGTIHIQGPVLTNKNENYYITVSIVAKDNKFFSPPLSDTFILPSTQNAAFKMMTNPAMESVGKPLPQITNTEPTGNYTVTNTPHH